MVLLQSSEAVLLMPVLVADWDEIRIFAQLGEKPPPDAFSIAGDNTKSAKRVAQLPQVELFLATAA
jgi:hypothetical protein